MIEVLFSLFLNLAKAQETPAVAAEYKVSGQLGYRFRSYLEKSFQAHAPNFELNWERVLSQDDWKTTVNVGGRYFKIDDHELEPLIYFGYQKGNWSLKAGYQVVSWGQSFAVFSADLVNPKDLRDPLNADAEWTNIPNFLINAEYFFEGGGAQFILTPLPRNNKYSRPDRESDFLKSQGIPLKFTSPDQVPKNPTSEDFEFGAKANRVFKNGWEFSLFGLRHWNRNAVYLKAIEGLEIKLKPQRFQLDSYGLGFSKDLNDSFEGLVARGDLVAHLYDEEPNETATALIKGTTYDAVVGVDWTSSSGLTLGAQAVNHDRLLARERIGTLKATQKMLQDKLELSALIYFGLNTKESWFQPEIRWFVSQNLELSLKADLIQADSQDTWSSLAALKKEDRSQFELKYIF